MQGKRGAILTTHSMEEADALSSRVGIMVKGELKYVLVIQESVILVPDLNELKLFLLSINGPTRPKRTSSGGFRRVRKLFLPVLLSIRWANLDGTGCSNCCVIG